MPKTRGAQFHEDARGGLSDQDPIIRARQLACKHAMIKPFAASVERCVHCGVSAADWKKMQEEIGMWAGVP
jgi:hypothetical protein